MDTMQTRSTARCWLGQAAIVTALIVALLTPVAPALATFEGAVTVRQTADAQTNVGGGVTVNVSRLDTAGAVVFKVVLDTHAVNLDSYDLAQLAVIRTPSGEEVAPLAWEAPAGGHHREGNLTFPVTVADGTPLIQADGGHLILVIRDIAGIAERAFHWAA
jgi:hypothetical protein